MAECESNQNWSINTGNGYYGGLQFSAQSWRAVGGSGLPHQASKQEQIERAYELWKIQGWGAWPACSQSLGLSGDPGGWGDDYFDVHGGTQTSSGTVSSGEIRTSYSVPLREEPSTSAEKLAQIPRGEVLRTGDTEGTWVQVEFETDSGTQLGWVDLTYLTAA